jgi:hypothetical protein
MDFIQTVSHAKELKQRINDALTQSEIVEVADEIVDLFLKSDEPYFVVVIAVREFARQFPRSKELFQSIIPRLIEEIGIWSPDAPIVLGMLQATEAIPALVNLFEDDIQAAAIGLGLMGAPAVPFLMELAHNTERSSLIREYAVIGLNNNPDHSALAALRELSQSQDTLIADYATTYLRNKPASSE